MNLWDLLMLKLRAAFTTHGADAAAHHAKYTDVEAVTAVEGETSIDLNKLTITNQPHCHASHSTTPFSQTIPTGVWTKLDYNQSIFDNDNMINLTTNKVTIKTVGYYIIMGEIQFEAAGGVVLMQLSIYINGAQHKNVFGYSQYTHGLNNIYFHQMAVNDYIEIYVKHNKGSDLRVFGGGTHNFIVNKLY